MILDQAAAPLVNAFIGPLVEVAGRAGEGLMPDSVINKKLWISKNTEFLTIFKLDRMARSVACSNKAG